MGVKCELFEVLKMDDGPRSWFLDNTVQTGIILTHAASFKFIT